MSCDISVFLETTTLLRILNISTNLKMISRRTSLDMKVYIEVFGPDPPCARCHAVWKNVEKAASTLKQEGVEVMMKRLDIMSKDAISKYGVLMSPALAVNGTVKTMGRIPDAREVERLIREAAK